MLPSARNVGTRRTVPTSLAIRFSCAVRDFFSFVRNKRQPVPAYTTGNIDGLSRYWKMSSIQSQSFRTWDTLCS